MIDPNFTLVQNNGAKYEMKNIIKTRGIYKYIKNIMKIIGRQ